MPIEYLVPDDRPKRVLVCGWGEQSFMRAVLRELDHGQMALPAGSEVRGLWLRLWVGWCAGWRMGTLKCACGAAVMM